MRRITIDHIHPLAAGGPDVWDNVTASCPACNTFKQTLSLLEVLMLNSRGMWPQKHIFERKRRRAAGAKIARRPNSLRLDTAYGFDPKSLQVSQV